MRQYARRRRTKIAVSDAGRGPVEWPQKEFSVTPFSATRRLARTSVVKPSLALHSSTPHLSIVLPCLNGAAYIEGTLLALAAWLASHADTVGTTEIILVDDGSRDDTVGVAAASGIPFRLVQLGHNLGKGAAVRRGMAEARGEFRLFMDADLPFDLDVIERVLHYLDFKEFDICIGSRTTREDAPLAVRRSALRRFASGIFSELVGRLIVTGVRDTQCGIKGFRAEVARYLFGQSRVDNFAFDVELLYLAFKNGFDVKSIPVRLLEEQGSTVRIGSHVLPMLIDVIRLPFRGHRGGYMLYGGGLTR